MDELVVQLENGKYILMQFSDSPATTLGNDSAVDYTVYDMDREEIDSGQMDYNSFITSYYSIEYVIDDVIDHIFGDDYDGDYEITELTREDFE